MGVLRLNAVEIQTEAASMAKTSLYSNPTHPLVTVDSMVESLATLNKLNDEAKNEILSLARKAIHAGELNSHDAQTTARITDINKATPLVTPQEFKDWVVIVGIALKLPTLKPKKPRVKKQVIQTNNWRMRIQTQAASHILALRKGGASPTIHSIINDLHAWCVQNNVRSDRGVVPSPGYLRTHVLGGKYWTPPP
jgi:hypothetical protein